MSEITVTTDLLLQGYPQLRVHFFGKNPNPDSESKNGFFVSLEKSKKGL